MGLGGTEDDVFGVPEFQAFVLGDAVPEVES
jgi:hypothetical protein